MNEGTRAQSHITLLYHTLADLSHAGHCHCHPILIAVPTPILTVVPTPILIVVPTPIFIAVSTPIPIVGLGVNLEWDLVVSFSLLWLSQCTPFTCAG